MSIRMWIGKKQILHTKTSDIEFIHKFMQEDIFSQDIVLTPALDNLMAHLEFGGGGVGVDFSEYLIIKKDADLFLELLKKAIEKMENLYIPPYKEERMKLLWHFYHELENYAQELS